MQPRENEMLSLRSPLPAVEQVPLRDGQASIVVRPCPQLVVRRTPEVEAASFLTALLRALGAAAA